LPATLTSWGSDFSVSARPLIYYPNNGLFPINAQWDVKRTAGNSQAEIDLQWVKNVENYNFSLFRRSVKVFRGEWGNWFSLGSQDWGYNEINANTFSKKVPYIDYFTTFTVLTETIIPVELKRFGAKKQANNDVLLTWETATEIDNAGFDVEKSTNGAQFYSMGFVKGFGNSVASNSYNLTDNNFVNTAYYRLKQMDNNGKTTYSKIVSVQKDNGILALNVYPNLVMGQSEITVDLINASENARELSVFDTNGRLVFYENKFSKDVQSTNIPVVDLANGVYWIKAKIGQETLVSKFVKH
jgi:Secretion system C-terminal sorting domain